MSDVQEMISNIQTQRRRCGFFAFTFLIMSLLLVTDALAKVVEITNIRVSVDKGMNRFVFDTTDRVQYKVFTLSRPDRVVIDIKNARLSAEIPTTLLDKTVVKAIRTSKNKDNLRLVLDLKSPIETDDFLLQPSGSHGQRLVLDLKSDDISSKVKSVPTSTPALTSEVVASKTQAKHRDVIVIIDPGHGGKDPGAIGQRKNQEKKVVLAIAKYLSKELNNTKGYKVVLTRTKDNYIPLRRRLDLARSSHGDMFVSIHADAFKDKRAHGASVFALSQRGASSEAARWLAAKENYSELGGVDLDNKSDVLRSVLLDLSQTATVTSSLVLGDTVLKQLGKVAKLHNKKVEQAGFVVLKSPDIPSILIETGFISNNREERLLTSSAYQQKLAKAIARGIRNYFWEYSPQGTLVASYKKDKKYVVKSGDTLSDIAQRFHLSVKEIRDTNKLRSNSIRKGQVLTIPVSQG